MLPAASGTATAIAPAPLRPNETRPEAAERVLFLATHLRTKELRNACPDTLEADARVRCLIMLRYVDDEESRDLALTLFAETGSLAGLLPEETTEDARGEKIRLRPARPVGSNRDHLRWIIAAMRDYKHFIDGLTAIKPVSFRFKSLDFRFFYSEKGHMPSAFAFRQNVGYNLFGAVNVSEEAVRTTLFHEIVHLNDGWHGEWSSRALADVYYKILARCSKRNACLAAYAPTDTMLEGHYYSFAPKSTVREYAAETALRYYIEHRLLLDKKPLTQKPFKCGPEENREAWRLIVDELFGGIDLTTCP